MSTQKESEKEAAFVESFKALYREKKYPHAFIIASKYPELKETPEYVKMQEYFQKLLKAAARYIKKDQTYKAEELIGEYVRVEEKRIVVKLLLAFGEEFFSFLKALQTWDVETVFAMTKRYPEFAKVPSFISMKQEMQKRLFALEEKMDAMELDADFSLIGMWESYLTEAKRLQNKLAALQKLQSFYEDERWDICYEMIEENEFVQDSLLTQLLRKHWYKRLEEAKGYALQGDIAHTYKVLKEFGGIASKKGEIERLLYFAAKRDISNLIEQKRYGEAERLLFEAAERFGKRDDLVELAEFYYKSSGVRVVFG